MNAISGLQDDMATSLCKFLKNKPIVELKIALWQKKEQETFSGFSEANVLRFSWLLRRLLYLKQLTVSIPDSDVSQNIRNHLIATINQKQLQVTNFSGLRQRGAYLHLKRKYLFDRSKRMIKYAFVFEKE